MSDDGIQMLVGQTIVEVVGMHAGSESVYFRCSSGDWFVMDHMQACCESVDVYEVIGDSSLLNGHQVLSASKDANHDWDGDGEPESHTWTIYTITTAAGSVVIKWLGVSNGYYSESVYFSRTHKPIDITKGR